MERSMWALLLAVLIAAPATAEESRAAFRVSVSVPPRATLTVLDCPVAVEVSEADLARGYVGLSARYRVSHNAPRGYLLQFAPRSGLAQQVEISGLDAAPELVLRDEPLEVYQVAADRRDELALQFKVVLDGSAGPGRYPLPFELAAYPL